MQYFHVEDCQQFLDKIPNGYLVEFGIFSGNTLNRLIKLAEQVNKPFEAVYGFDSFCGIPKETEGVLHNPEWPEGAFNVQRDFNLNSVEQAIAFVKDRVERQDINLIPGFFSESLTDEIGEKLRDKASFINIDVDLYSSSIEVLNFMLQHQILKIGGLMRMDDTLWCKWSEAGNSLAFIEMNRKYRPNWNRISQNLFQLVAY